MCKYTIISACSVPNGREDTCQQSQCIKYPKLCDGNYICKLTVASTFLQFKKYWWRLFPHASSKSVTICKTIWHIETKLAKSIAFKVEKGARNGSALRMFTWVGKHVLLLSRGSGSPQLFHKCEVFRNSSLWRLF